jgi:PIN domain nuclease of toxin-antitoxin system
MAAFVGELPALLERQGGASADLAPAICTAAGLMDWSHRDPFDRMLAATALHYALPLVSADAVFDGITARIW